MSASLTMHDRQKALLGTLYAEDFDAAEIVPAVPDAMPEPEPADPVFTAADMEVAGAEGHATGRAESDHSLMATRVQMLGLVGSGMHDATTAATLVAEAASEAIARTMLGAIAACLPALCTRHGEAELRTLARALLPSLVDEPRITVRLNPLMMAGLALELAGLDPGIAERVLLVPADQMAPGDVRISWQNGSAVRNAGQTRLAVEDALAALGLLEKETIDA